MGVAVMENVSCAKMGAAVRKTREAIWSNMIDDGWTCLKESFERTVKDTGGNRTSLSLRRKLQCK